MQFKSITAALVSLSPVFAIPPESFGFPSAPNDTALSITYQNGNQQVVISEAELLGIDVPQNPPTVAVAPANYSSIASYNGLYTLLVVDPDASTPQNPTERFFLHWAQPNLTASSTGVLTNVTPPFVPYTRPAPPPYSDAHRYIFYAFQQPANFAIPASFMSFNAENRGLFNLTDFISQTSLGQPAAANYFFVENKTMVPSNFTAPAGSMFPGGNGGAVTDGPSPVANATATSSMSGGASSTPSSGYTGAAAAVDVSKGVHFALAVLGGYAFWAL